jgi:hypothetical protein
VGFAMSPRNKLIALIAGGVVGYAAAAYFALSVIGIGSTTFGVFSVLAACGYAFWLAGAAREYAESPEPLTPEAKKAGEEALERLLARKKGRG